MFAASGTWSEPPSVAPKTIPADRIVTLAVNMERGNGYCSLLVSFLPLKGRRYELHPSFDWPTCKLIVRDVTQQPMTNLALAQRTRTDGKNGRWCEPANTSALPRASGGTADGKDGETTMNDLRGLLPAK